MSNFRAFGGAIMTGSDIANLKVTTDVKQQHYGFKYAFETFFGAALVKLMYWLGIKQQSFLLKNGRNTNDKLDAITSMYRPIDETGTFAGRKAVKSLIRALDDKHPHVISEAATMLGRIGMEQAYIPSLFILLFFRSLE